MSRRTTLQELESSVARLDKAVRDNYQEILDRLRALELEQPSSSRRLSRLYISTFGTRKPPSAGMRSTISFADSKDLDSSSIRARRTSRFFFRLAFEKDLASTRVYKRINFNRSTTSSIMTTEEPGTAWSSISGPSVADVVSQLSVLNLAITYGEVYRADQYMDKAKKILPS